MKGVLKVEHLSKDLGGFQLKDIRFELKSGYIMGLVGVNGTGKTTLIQTILNLYQKDSGEVWVDGFSMSKEEKQAKERLGLVLDKNMFEEDMSVLANAKTFGKLYSKFDEALFRIFCEKFQVPLKQKLGKLSAGYKVRFQLAFALSHDADVFLLDEPSSGLDPIFRKELMGYLQEIVEDGTRSVLMSTHITEDLERIGDYIALMKDGEIVLHLSKEEWKERYLKIYGTKEEIEQLDCRYVIYREYGEHRSFAFVKKVSGEDYSGRKTKSPTLEEIMYALEKGGYEYV